MIIHVRKNLPLFGRKLVRGLALATTTNFVSSLRALTPHDFVVIIDLQVSDSVHSCFELSRQTASHGTFCSQRQTQYRKRCPVCNCLNTDCRELDLAACPPKPDLRVVEAVLPCYALQLMSSGAAGFALPFGGEAALFIKFT